MIRLISGVTLCIAVLQPVTGMRIDKILKKEQFFPHSADPYLAMGEAAAREAQAQYIKEACEAYISSKAETLGAPLTVQVHLGETMVPIYAEIQGTADASVQEQLTLILEKELEITKENQLWIWNQENNSS